MEITKFEDMKIYHDTDWNEMQRKIYRAMKENDVLLSSQVNLLNSSYKYMFYDSFVDISDILSSNNLQFNENKFVIESGGSDSSLDTVDHTIDITTDTVYLDVDVNGDSSLITYSISTDSGSSWQAIDVFTDIVLPQQSDTFRLRFEIPANSEIELVSYTLYLDNS